MKSDEDRWIFVDKRSNKLVIRFYIRGFKKQFFIASGLKDSKKNREIVRLKRDAIATDIALERFDFSLDKYQFGIKSNTQLIETQVINIDITNLWEKFIAYKATQIEETTIRIKYNFILGQCRELPVQSLHKAVEIRDWLISNKCKYTAWLMLSSFSACCNWAVDSKLIPENPFENLRIKQPIKNRNKQSAFTLEQRDTIINAFENHELYSHYASLIKFLFYTGCRPGEAFALKWGDLSKDCRKIHINKSCNKFRILKGTKNNKHRIFPVSENSKLHKMLLAIKPEKSNGLVFTSKKGCPINTNLTTKIWNKTEYKGYYRDGVVRELAEKGVVPYLKPYSTRHTFATWAITQGVSPDKVALWIGDTIETVLKFYCHPDVVDSECPDF